MNIIEEMSKKENKWFTSLVIDEFINNRIYKTI